MRKCSTCGVLYEGDLCPTCIAGFAQKKSDPQVPAEELPLQPGQTFHGMEIVSLLGKGGMGVVYKARQPALDRIVALKLLPQNLALDPNFQDRFIREAKALGALSHPNIVMVHDFGAEGGLFYFIMEFVDGVNLRQVLREKTLTPEKAIRVVPQLCDALEYAHVEGVVHRDIKPENILIDKKGRIKITDFGLAKLVGTDQPAMLTQTNMVMGTPHYMAPEQVENPKSVDHRADIYSLGVVFYEMLTGELPIGRFELPSKKVQVDVRMDEVVLKTLEKAPDRRYQHVSDFKTAVTNLTTASSEASYQPTVITPKPEDKTPKKPSGSKSVVVAGLLAAAAMLVVAIVLSMSGSSDTAGTVIANANSLFNEGKYGQAKALYETALKLDPSEDQKALVTMRLDKCAEELSAGPIDLSPIFFESGIRMGGYAYARTDELLVRNPLLAKGPDELDKVVKVMDNMGLSNVARDDIKQAYLAVWGGARSYAYALALDTPAARQLEDAVAGLENMSHKWSHRKGEFLVVGFTYMREMRPCFLAMVNHFQKSLRLPETEPVLPVANLRFKERYVISGWKILEERKPAPLPGEQESYFVTFSPEKEPKPAIEYDVVRFETEEQAKNFEADRKKESRHKNEVWRAGTTVAVLTLTSNEIYGFQRLVYIIRRWLGLKEYTFESFLLESPEVPEGFRISSIETDVRKVLDTLRLGKVDANEISRAWMATLTPPGTVAVVELKDYSRRRQLEDPLRKRKAAYYYRNEWLFVADGPDEDTAWALEDVMRAKFSLSPKRRYAELSHARLLDADVPEGFTLDLESSTRSTLSGKLVGPDVTLKYSAVQTFDFGKVETAREELKDVPGDLVLKKDTVLLHIAGPEKAWPVLDTLEKTLRRKLRMGDPNLGDYLLDRWMLPEGRRFSDRQDLGYSPNPLSGTEAVKQMGFADASVFAGAWIGFIEPREAEVMMVQLSDPASAGAVAATLKAKLAGAPNSALYVKGPFVIAVRQVHKTDDSTFRALSDLLRGRLRVKKN